MRRTKRRAQEPTRLLFHPSGLVLRDGAASDDEEISALGASPARPRAGGSAASSPTLSLPESFSNLGGEPAPPGRMPGQMPVASTLTQSGGGDSHGAEDMEAEDAE